MKLSNLHVAVALVALLPTEARRRNYATHKAVNPLPDLYHEGDGGGHGGGPGAGNLSAVPERMQQPLVSARGGAASVANGSFLRPPRQKYWYVGCYEFNHMERCGTDWKVGDPNTWMVPATMAGVEQCRKCCLEKKKAKFFGFECPVGARNPPEVACECARTEEYARRGPEYERRGGKSFDRTKCMKYREDHDGKFCSGPFSVRAQVGGLYALGAAEIGSVYLADLPDYAYGGCLVDDGMVSAKDSTSWGLCGHRAFEALGKEKAVFGMELPGSGIEGEARCVVFKGEHLIMPLAKDQECNEKQDYDGHFLGGKKRIAFYWTKAEDRKVTTTTSTTTTTNPETRLCELLEDLRQRVRGDGKKEADSYDKYACYCKDTLARKASKISEMKELIAELEAKMKGLAAEIASYGAEIQQLNADIKDNSESQREANDVRDEETRQYTKGKLEAEQAIGALEQAIKVLTGAGAGKPGFLQTEQKAQLLSIVGGVREVVSSAASERISGHDLDLVKRFLERPTESGVMSAMQTANNPFGDYAPQSTQIQGVLKSLYDSMTGDLEKANADEAKQQEAHEELIETKQEELETLQVTLEKRTVQKATAADEHSKSKTLRDDTKHQLEADEAFFADTEAECKLKAAEWSERERLRTEELQGIKNTQDILCSDEAKNTFEISWTPALVQTASRRISWTPALVQTYMRRTGSGERSAAYRRLRDLANRLGSAGLASAAAELRTSGHFDEVIVSIDKMIALLRAEEKADLEHRDRCQNAWRKATQDKEDFTKVGKKTEKELKSMAIEWGELFQKIEDLRQDIMETEQAMRRALAMRNEEREDFEEELKTDTDAIDLLNRAIAALSKFYKTNKIPPSLVQKGKRAPEYSKDDDRPPETPWSGTDYKGRNRESFNIVAILELLKEDLEKEISVARSEEAESQQAYDNNRAASQEIIDTTAATKLATEKDLADLENRKAETEQDFVQLKADSLANEELLESLKKDCAWVKTHFEKRRKKRKTEIDGLVEAKGYLAGAVDGADF